MIIESGTGNGRLVGVDDDNRLLAAAFNIPFPHLIAKDYRKVFVAFGQSATMSSAQDYSVLYLGNNTEDQVFVLHRMTAQIIGSNATLPGAGDYFKLEMNSEYASGGTAVTPVNTSSGSSVVSGAAAYEGSFALTGAPLVADVVHPAADGQYISVDLEGGILVPPGKAISIGYTHSGTAGFANSSLYFSVVSADGYSG